MGDEYIIRGTWGGGVVEFSNGDTFVKVISFPVRDSSPFAGESMWVLLEDGDEFNGTGILDNDPIHSDIECGALIEFEGGTEEYKPHFVRVIDDFESPQDAYTLAYSKGHEKGRVNDSYSPETDFNGVKDLFRDSYKQKHRAETFEASGPDADTTINGYPRRTVRKPGMEDDRYDIQCVWCGRWFDQDSVDSGDPRADMIENDGCWRCWKYRNRNWKDFVAETFEAPTDWDCKHENWHPLGHFHTGMGSPDTMWILCDDCGRYGQIHFRPSFDTKGSPRAKNEWLKMKNATYEGGVKLFDAESFESPSWNCLDCGGKMETVESSYEECVDCGWAYGAETFEARTYPDAQVCSECQMYGYWDDNPVCPMCRHKSETFGAERVCPCGCAMVGCVCPPTCKGECRRKGAESFAASKDNALPKCIRCGEPAPIRAPTHWKGAYLPQPLCEGCYKKEWRAESFSAEGVNYKCLKNGKTYSRYRTYEKNTAYVHSSRFRPVFRVKACYNCYSLECTTALNPQIRWKKRDDWYKRSLLSESFEAPMNECVICATDYQPNLKIESCDMEYLADVEPHAACELHSETLKIEDQWRIICNECIDSVEDGDFADIEIEEYGADRDSSTHYPKGWYDLSPHDSAARGKTCEVCKKGEYLCNCWRCDHCETSNAINNDLCSICGTSRSESISSQAWPMYVKWESAGGVYELIENGAYGSIFPEWPILYLHLDEAQKNAYKPNDNDFATAEKAWELYHNLYTPEGIPVLNPRSSTVRLNPSEQSAETLSFSHSGDAQWSKPSTTIRPKKDWKTARVIGLTVGVASAIYLWSLKLKDGE